MRGFLVCGRAAIGRRLRRWCIRRLLAELQRLRHAGTLGAECEEIIARLRDESVEGVRRTQ